MAEEHRTLSKTGARRVFGRVELAFDALYLGTAFLLGLLFLLGSSSPERGLAALMAFVLAGGDLFHLAPRMLSIARGDEARYARAMGRGKQITSITMTVFYLLLWLYGVKAYGLSGYETAWGILYGLALLRIALCLPRANRWLSPEGDFRWAVLRNLPFAMMGTMCAALFIEHRAVIPALGGMGAAIILSFLFYLPVALMSGKNRKLGMLMLPKTLMYVWILLMIRASL